MRKQNNSTAINFAVERKLILIIHLKIKVMKKEILEMVENYETGFISPMELLNQFSDLLSYFGSNKELDDKINDLVLPLAYFVAKKLKAGEHFSFSEFKND